MLTAVSRRLKHTVPHMGGAPTISACPVAYSEGICEEHGVTDDLGDGTVTRGDPKARPESRWTSGGQTPGAGAEQRQGQTPGANRGVGGTTPHLGYPVPPPGKAEAPLTDSLLHGVLLGGGPSKFWPALQPQPSSVTLTVLVRRWLQGVEDALGAVWREARAACWARGAGGARAPHLSRKPTGPWRPQEACGGKRGVTGGPGLLTDLTEMRNRPGRARWWPLVPEPPWRAVLGCNEMTSRPQPVQRGPGAARREVREVT